MNIIRIFKQDDILYLESESGHIHKCDEDSAKMVNFAYENKIENGFSVSYRDYVIKYQSMSASDLIDHNE